MVKAADTRHPAPHRDRIGTVESAFALLGAPLAWYLHMNFGYAMVQTRCESAHAASRMLPTAAGGVLALAIALASLGVALRALRRTRGEQPGGHHELAEIGAGRTRFLALWGVILAATFTLMTLVNGLALVLVPFCR